jgi:hypothetical protein
MQQSLEGLAYRLIKRDRQATERRIWMKKRLLDEKNQPFVVRICRPFKVRTTQYL